MITTNIYEIRDVLETAAKHIDTLQELVHRCYRSLTMLIDIAEAKTGDGKT